MGNLQSSDKDYDLWALLAQTREAMFKARQKELDPYGISPRQSAILFAVQSIGEKPTPAEISRRIYREPPTITERLNKMCEKGLVRKVKDLKRKNMVRIELTGAGRYAYQQSSKRESIHNIMSSLSNNPKGRVPRACPWVNVAMAI